MAHIASLYILSIVLWLGILEANAIDCGYQTTDPTGTIKGPYPASSYTNNPFQCVWSISVPPLNRIRLEFKSTSLPGKVVNHCSEDWILIESPTARGINVSHGVFCGSTLTSKNIVSWENKIRVKYNYVGHYKVDSYFTFNYVTVPLSQLEVAKYWIENTELKKENLPRGVSSLFLVDEKYFHPGNARAENITNELRLQLGEDLVRNFSHPMSPGDLSLRISALLAACINPRAVYGIDLVHQLRKLVNNIPGLPNPYFYLTLCNAGERITSSDIKKLTTVIETQKHEMYWIDYQAMALLALVCVKEQDEEVSVKKQIAKATAEIKSYQLNDGGFGSLHTTSLVIQALIAAESGETGWNRTSAMAFINSSAESDGLFGNIQNLYAVTPIISGKSLLYINTSNCDFTNDGETSMSQLRANLTHPILLEYSVWIGDKVDLISTMTLKAPKGTKFFDFMRLAADNDDQFKFLWINIKNSPYVYQIGWLINDPSSGKYWTLYTGTNKLNLQPFSKGLEHYIPRDGEQAIMWYRSISVEHSSQEHTE